MWFYYMGEYGGCMIKRIELERRLLASVVKVTYIVGDVVKVSSWFLGDAPKKIRDIVAEFDKKQCVKEFI